VRLFCNLDSLQCGAWWLLKINHQFAFSETRWQIKTLMSNLLQPKYSKDKKRFPDGCIWIAWAYLHPPMVSWSETPHLFWLTQCCLPACHAIWHHAVYFWRRAWVSGCCCLTHISPFLLRFALSFDGLLCCLTVKRTFGTLYICGLVSVTLSCTLPVNHDYFVSKRLYTMSWVLSTEVNSVVTESIMGRNLI